MKIKRALISVSDKSGVVEFARTLQKAGIEIVSTGGTMRRCVRRGFPLSMSVMSRDFPRSWMAASRP